jgi:hypothetical protein
MHVRGGALVLTTLLPVACATPSAVEATPEPAAAAIPESTLVYRALLGAPEFAANIQEVCPDGRPWIAADLMRNPEHLGFRWDVDYFEPWLDLVRYVPPPGAGPEVWWMPDDVLREFPGSGSAGVRLSRVGFSPDGRRAIVAWQVSRLGICFFGGIGCLDRGPAGWTLTKIDNDWALSV